MTKVVSINLGNFGSTGKIAYGIKDACATYNINVICAYPEDSANAPIDSSDMIIGNMFTRRMGRKLARLTGYNGCFSYFTTRRFLKRIDSYNPDIIHLHNLHNSYINLPLLFKYLKKKNTPVVWTLHDCWAFTGQCPHFTMVKCEKWKTGCHDCPQYKNYPSSYVDRTKTMWKLKKKWFTGVQNMTIVTPSQWLAGLVKESFLAEYPVKVINNGIDLDVFKPIESDFRQKYGLQDKHIVLGVAFGWGKRKGLDVFIELANRLDENFQVVLVGTNDEVDKRLPNNIVSIHRTVNQEELVKIYSAADVFVNPTREENYPTVNMEAIACGIPVVTFKTGGSPEILDEKCGFVVSYNNVDEMIKKIIYICLNRPFSKRDCIEQAKLFAKEDRFKEYVELYKKTAFIE